MKKWFLMNAGAIEGPYSPEEVDEKAPSAFEPLVWGRGLPEWLPPAEWRAALKSLGATLTEQIDPTLGAWRYKTRDGLESPVMTYAQVLQALISMRDHKGVFIQSPDSTAWVDLYQVQRLVDELGISRRAHLRVPILGTLEFVDPTGKTQQARIVAISEGGLALNQAAGYPIGQSFKAQLESPHLYAGIPCTCEVVYAGEDSTGLRFLQLPTEGQAAIVEYVTKFKNLGER